MFHPLSMLLSSVSIALIPSIVAASEILCGHLPIVAPRSLHCYILVQQLQHTDWFTRRTIYGNFAPEPGTTPKYSAYETCTFSIGNVRSGPQHGQSERIRLSDYVAELEQLARDCLSPGSGFNYGTFQVGNRKRFFAVLGGQDRQSKASLNGTLLE